MVRGVILCAALGVAGCATGQVDRTSSDAAEMAEALAGRTAGPAARCISLSATDAPRIVGETLIYRAGRTLWVSAARDGCSSLRGDPITVVEVNGNQLCAGDRFQTLPRNGVIPGPYCRFGSFVPYTRPK